MKYAIIIIGFFLTSCYSGKSYFETISYEESKGRLSENSSEIIEFQSQCFLEGNILGQSTKDSIIGATIVLFNKQAEFGTVSDYNGRFEIFNIPPDTYQLVVCLVGYHSFIDSLSFNPNEAKNISIELLISPIVIGNSNTTAANNR